MAEPAVKRHWFVRLLRRLWHVAVTLLVLLAVYQTGGRLLMASLGGQKEGIEAQLSQLLGARVTIGEVRGSWFRFSPSLELDELTITASTDQQHRVARMTVELDAVDSVLQARASIVRIHADGLNLALQEDATGRWSLAGLPRGTGPDYSQQIIDFLLQTRGIDFTEATLRLQRADGRVLVFDSLYLDLRNRGASHELQGQFRIDGQLTPSRLRMTLEGDPRSDFAASLYASAEALEAGSLLDTRDVGGWQLQDMRVSGEAWLDANQDGLQMLSTTLTDLTLSATHLATQRAVTLEQAELKAYLRPGADAWELGVTDLSFALQQAAWDIPALQLRWPADAAQALTARAGSIELGLLRQLVGIAPDLPESAVTIVNTLNPRGFLRNVQLETAPDGSWPGGFTLRANIADVAVDAWGGAPSGRGLQGYLQMDARKGFVDVDSDDVDLHLPRLFTEAWHYDHLNTRVQWTVGDDGFRVGSTAIDVRNDTVGTGLDGSVRFDLYSTRDASGAPVSELSLLVGMRSMDVALRSAYLPKLPRVQPTMDWLQAALQGGRIRDSGFLLRTSTIPNGPPGSSTFSTWYHVDDGVLQFLPDWPALGNIIGDVVVRDGKVIVRTQEASIAGMALEPAVATVEPQAAGGSLLTVRGTANTDTGSGLAFLRESPVRDAIGPVIDNWEAAGRIGVDIALDIPLGGNSGQREDQRIIDVKVQSTDSQLVLNDYALTIDDIDGLVSYHSATGLSASAVNASMFDFPIVAGIESLGDLAAGRRTRVTATGRASVAALRAWQRQPELVRNLLGYTRGEIDYTATLDILHRTGADGIRTRLQLASDLVGLESELPRPFGKTPEEVDNLDMELTFLTDGQVLAARYDDFVSGRIVLDAGGVDRGQLFFGERNRDFNIRQADETTPGLLLNGELPYFNYEEWLALTDAMAGQATTPQRPLAEYLRLVDMQFGVLEVVGQQLENIAVQVRVDDGGWQIDGLNALVGGHLTIPLDATPWTASLDYLRFPPRVEPELDAAGKPVAEEKVDILEAVDPSTLPPFDFTTAELSIGDQNLGAFDFRLRPDRNGATITDFRMRAPDSSISDVALTGGASIDWRFGNGLHASRFDGAFTATDLAQVLPRWGHGANVESEQASFSGMLEWEGSPLAFTLADTSGQLQLDIRDGRFVDIEAGSARVFGALNFDALVRRLQLDFSDIFESGYNFDSIAGDLSLDHGLVTTTGPVVIDGPASRISINGEIDLAQETIAADMEVQIPLGQNLSMLAGLLGAWPIAVSTYLASIIFADKVADFATVIYRLDGPWENPNAGFEAPADTTTQEP
jgi:uncharacterized protein (TIGR02099 family)